jgi:hypothetical protein
MVTTIRKSLAAERKLQLHWLEKKRLGDVHNLFNLKTPKAIHLVRESMWIKTHTLTMYKRSRRTMFER